LFDLAVLDGLVCWVLFGLLLFLTADESLSFLADELAGRVDCGGGCGILFGCVVLELVSGFMTVLDRSDEKRFLVEFEEVSELFLIGLEVYDEGVR